jgi:large subunit ribosomal protein L21
VVVSHGRGTKIRVCKFKRRRDYRRRAGHRAAFTELRIRSVSAGG